jgi:hypothetical protein
MTDTQPQDMSALAGGTTGNGIATVTAPTAQPPAVAGAGIAGAGIAGGAIGASVWVDNKKVNALWSINENRNSWIGVAGVGWVKLANNSDSAIVALTMLGANAKLTQGIVRYRQESDNMIHEMYVW